MAATIWSVISAVFVLIGAFGFLVSAIGMLRVRDAVSRVNSLGPATAVGIPFILVGTFIYKTLNSGLNVTDLIAMSLAILASIIVSSLASNTLGRAAYRSGAPLDPKTEPNELAGR
ncbi:MAG: monovalent cation/H(+) antiporter subunit G [Actinomycetia bacterium]|nr:monovalent cation/H(+) antiporter subunit G [Actinomycetes bacterium]